MTAPSQLLATHASIQERGGTSSSTRTVYEAMPRKNERDVTRAAAHLISVHVAHF